MRRSWSIRVPEIGGVAIIAGGVLASIGAILAWDVFTSIGLDLQAVLILAACGATAVCGALSFGQRRRPIAATVALVFAMAAFSLAWGTAWFAVIEDVGASAYLMLAGTLVAGLGAVALLATIAIDVVPSWEAALVGIVAGVSAAVGALLSWFPGARGNSAAPGWMVLVAAAVLAGATLAALALHGSALRAGLLAIAVGAGVAGGVEAIHVGVQFPGSTYGLYVSALGCMVGAAAAASMLARSLGMPEPAFPGWVAGMFLAFGLLGLVLTIAMEDEIEDAGASLFAVRIGAWFLLVTGAGLATHQPWAWLLGFPLASTGVANAALGVVLNTSGRGFSFLALILYASALRALWQSRLAAVVVPTMPLPPPPLPPPPAPAG